MRYEKATLDLIKRLRHGGPLRMFDRSTKLFHHIQLDKKDKGIFWERYVSKDRQNWTRWDCKLRLSDVLDIRAQIAISNQAECFSH